MRLQSLLIVVVLFLLLSACTAALPATPTPTATPLPTPTLEPTLPPPTPLPTPAVEPTLPPPTPTAAPDRPSPTPTAAPDPGRPERPEAAILILEPGPGSRVTSPIRVAGEADPTFEQSLTVRVVSDEGVELAIAAAQIEADMGQRGPFAVDVPVATDETRQIFVQVYAISARDGGITHLNSVGLRLAPAGQEDIVPVTPQPERVVIFQPAFGETISGGVAHVEGFGLASFEQTLVIEVVDADGNVVGMEPVMVQAPDLGQPGPFSGDVPYSVTEAGPGRIVVRDISPAFGGDSYRTSVEITLEP